MADATLPVLSHPDFPQTFAAAIDLAVRRIFARPELGQCHYCHREAIVHDLVTEKEVCLTHLGEVLL